MKSLLIAYSATMAFALVVLYGQVGRAADRRDKLIVGQDHGKDEKEFAWAVPPGGHIVAVQAELFDGWIGRLVVKYTPGAGQAVDAVAWGDHPDGSSDQRWTRPFPVPQDAYVTGIKADHDDGHSIRRIFVFASDGNFGSLHNGEVGKNAEWSKAGGEEEVVGFFGKWGGPNGDGVLDQIGVIARSRGNGAQGGPPALAIPAPALEKARRAAQDYVEGKELVENTKAFLNQALRERGKQPGDFTVGARWKFVDLDVAHRNIDGHEVPGVTLRLKGQLWIDPNVGENDAFFDVAVFVFMANRPDGSKGIEVDNPTISNVVAKSDTWLPGNPGTFPGLLKHLVETEAGPAIKDIVITTLNRYFDQ